MKYGPQIRAKATMTVLFKSKPSSFLPSSAPSCVALAAVNLIFVCASYGSLYLLSSQSYVTLCGLLFLVSQSACPSSLALLKSYGFQCYKTLIFANASLCALLVSVAIHKGFNVTYIIHLVCTNKRFHLSTNSGLVVQINAMPASDAQTKMAALCLSSFSLYRLARILDLGYIHLLATLGSIGVKVLVLIQ
jgi:hypothetical protein